MNPAPAVFAAIIILPAAIAATATWMILRHHISPPPPPLPHRRAGEIAPPTLVITPARQGWKPAPPGTDPVAPAGMVTVVVMLAVVGATTITLGLLGEVRTALATLSLVLAAVALSAAGYATGRSALLHSRLPASRERGIPPGSKTPPTGNATSWRPFSCHVL